MTAQAYGADPFFAELHARPRIYSTGILEHKWYGKKHAGPFDLLGGLSLTKGNTSSETIETIATYKVQAVHKCHNFNNPPMHSSSFTRDVKDVRFNARISKQSPKILLNVHHIKAYEQVHFLQR